MRIKRLVAGLLFAVIVLGGSSLVVQNAAAADYPKLQVRSLAIGTSVPGETTDYTFSWRYPSNTTVRSVRMQLCFDAYVEDACASTPPGDFSSATLTSQTGAVTGFTVASQAADEILLTRAAGAAGTGQSTYVFDGVVNPTGVHSVFFVRIYTYASVDGTGTPNHMSSVANATAEPIVITTEVPPILFFCAGLTVSDWCESVAGDHIDYGSLDPCVTDVGTSQFGVATNAIGGYVVTANGNTLTSGNKQITNLDILTPNTPCTGQFGLNLRANTGPPAGADVTGAGIGVVAPGYNVPDQFKFVDGETIATAATGTMWNTYTVTYIVNIDNDQPSGIYNTTIAYICTAAF